MAETKTKINVLFFNTFKQSLALFLEDNLNACTPFIDGVKNAENEIELVRFFKKNHIDVYERLGGNLKYDSGADDLEYKIDKFERKVSELEYELEVANKMCGTTLDDDYKLEHFIKYKNDFMESELEELLKNGKEYLKIKV